MKKRSSNPPTSRNRAVGMNIAAPVPNRTSFATSHSPVSGFSTSRL
jgi:hypothetical protein